MIVAITPNLALDRTSRLDRPLSSGSLHRSLHVREAAGGKGVNLARTVAALGGQCLVAGFLAGWNGRKLQALLARDGLEGVFVEVEGETRECHILIDDVTPHPTEVNEAGPAVTAGDWHQLLSRLPRGRWVLSGSLPPSTTPDEFADILAALPQPPVVDTSGPPLRIALERGAYLLKPNQHELSALSGSIDAGLAEARALYERWGTPLLLTLGAEGAALIREEVHFAAAPAVASANPVGSGDALLGAFLWALEEGRPPVDALRLGVAAGADNARRGGGGRVTREGIFELEAQVEVDRLP